MDNSNILKKKNDKQNFAVLWSQPLQTAAMLFFLYVRGKLFRQPGSGNPPQDKTNTACFSVFNNWLYVKDTKGEIIPHSKKEKNLQEYNSR